MGRKRPLHTEDTEPAHTRKLSSVMNDWPKGFQYDDMNVVVRPTIRNVHQISQNLPVRIASFGLYGWSTVWPPIVTAKGKYFPVEVASNVPRVFLILAVIYLIMEVIGLLLIVEPTEEELEGLKEKHLPIAADPKSERASRHVIPRESDWLHAS